MAFFLQVVSNDDSTFKEPYPPSDCSTRAEGASIVGGFISNLPLLFLLILFKDGPGRDMIVQNGKTALE